jgi:hypothetical protein
VEAKGRHIASSYRPKDVPTQNCMKMLCKLHILSFNETGSSNVVLSDLRTHDPPASDF